MEGDIQQPNTTVAIAEIFITTESCEKKVHPIYADPGNILLIFIFLCCEVLINVFQCQIVKM